MNIDLCTLTEDLLPLYAEDLLSPVTRQLLEQHADGCPACRERLRETRAPQPPPAPAEPPRLERPARAFFWRLQRILSAGLAAVVLLMVATGTLSYLLGRRSHWEREQIPARVSGAEELARRAIPGWERATSHGLVLDVGVTERIPRTDAAVTIEKAWYSGRQVYLLYTVTAPEGGYWFPTEAYLLDGTQDRVLTHGGTDWGHLATWGGFSAEGFHAVLILNGIDPEPGGTHVELVLRPWMRIDPRTGPQRTGVGATMWAELRIRLPWEDDYLREPAPEVVPWPRQHTWLGRTLALEALEVGIGRTRLTGTITLPQGERDPVLHATLIIGEQELHGRYAAQPVGEPGRYRFTITYDGLNQWPAPVGLRLQGITFVTDQVLEWPVNWAKYRERTSSRDGEMDPADQVSLPFYDSELVARFATDSGVGIEQRTPRREPPYVRSALRMGGRLPLETAEPGEPPALGPGFEIENDAREVMTNLGGAAGRDDIRANEERIRVWAMWWNELPESFRRSERIIVRYVHPSATLVLDETWTAPGVR